ncbi:uncharacterized protein DEA37_0004894 [Paragonimus westermani]|uniref:Major facilitator superfamily (MFS) profile domain-containing protein n=1 Tax=Paragonimus westermani TaxID=34504 RepID=A0A5J4NC03_9TREM|nr:uncharacterized protein DEA37_0004894 [Paragonimus westermani]
MTLENDTPEISDMSTSTELLTILPEKKAKVTVTILIVVNLLNYMDRFTIAGIPNYVQQYYSINDDQFGLLQTAFFVSYTLLSPVAGYFGDRWRRKYIMLIGLMFWVAITLASSFVPAHLFYFFLLTRCLVGIGEASYSTIAPTIVSDLYTGSDRTKALGFFYFAVPVGSGLGYVIGSAMARWTDQWQWSLRVTPILGIGCILLLMYLHHDPPRGQAEGAIRLTATSWLVDLRSLLCNPAFMLVSGAFTCVSFILGAVTWFAVQLIEMGINARYDDPTAWRMYDVPLIFGICLCFSGIIGVLVGAFLGRYFRQYLPTADALICAASQFVCAPVLFGALLAPSVNFFLCVVLVFIVDLLLCISWALVSDITMSVVVPNRRATASAVQMIMTHALGDCISPAIVGAISVAIADSASLEMRFLSLQRALFLTPFVCVLSAFLFCTTSLFVVSAKDAVHKFIEESKLPSGAYEPDGGIPVSPSSDRDVHA